MTEGTEWADERLLPAYEKERAEAKDVTTRVQEIEEAMIGVLLLNREVTVVNQHQTGFRTA